MSKDSQLIDLVIRCVECGETFVFSGDEQRCYRGQGFSNPKMCPKCRKWKRAKKKEGIRTFQVRDGTGNIRVHIRFTGRKSGSHKRG